MLCIAIGAFTIWHTDEVSAQNKKKIPAQTDESSKKMDAFISKLMLKMTLEEKVGQMTMIAGSDAITGPVSSSNTNGADLRKGRIGSILNSFGAQKTRQLQKIAVTETRLKIPLIVGYDVIHGYRTIFPIPLGEACSWDLNLMKNTARIAGKEASAVGINWTFAPMVDIARDARWGRIAEGAGEDPYLGARVANARVRGFQGDDLSNPTSLLACAKHFAGYGAAIAGLDYNASEISERTLREIYLPPFKAASDAGAGSFMNAFNSLDGIPATANKLLVSQILKKEWKYGGLVVSDYNSITEMIAHGLAADKNEAAKLAANAQCDIDMVSNAYRDELVKLVRARKVSVSVINDAVKRILQAKYKLGLFADPYKNCDTLREKTDMSTPEAVRLARDAGRKSIVLLKNEGQILPLNKNIKSLAVIGALADDQKNMLGTWHAHGQSTDVITILQGIKEAVANTTKVYYSRGCELDAKKEEDFTGAVQVAQKSDAVIIIAGEYAEWTGEAHSRTDLGLPGNQLQLIKEIEKLGKPVVVVLANGRPLAINWLADNVPAIVESWFLGIEAGHSIADVLFGDFNPSGKLVVSFPYNVGQEPLYYNHPSSGRPAKNDKMDIYRMHYLDSPTDALYPFGYGLSYTSFVYTNFKTDKQKIKRRDKLLITVDVKNNGNMSGEEVVQLYLHDIVASVTRPVKELKRFEKVYLKPGETKTVKFELTENDLKYYNNDLKWVADAGEFELFAGGNSRDVLETKFRLTN